jgi:hypothetical protein
MTMAERLPCIQLVNIAFRDAASTIRALLGSSILLVSCAERSGCPIHRAFLCILHIRWYDPGIAELHGIGRGCFRMCDRLPLEWHTQFWLLDLASDLAATRARQIQGKPYNWNSQAV